MKYLFTVILLSFLLPGCKKNPIAVSTSLEQVSITTEKDSYSQWDSVNIIIENKSGQDILLGYRCTYNNLEMYFQKQENDKWSKNQWFAYMSLKCMTIIRKINKDNTLQHSLAANEFKTVGKFRLSVPVYFPERDTTLTAFSNTFEIQ